MRRPSCCWSASSSARSGRWLRPGAAAGRRRDCTSRSSACSPSLRCCRPCWWRSLPIFTIDRGLDRLFSGPTREVIENSLIVANAYLHEHVQAIPRRYSWEWRTISRTRGPVRQDRGTFRRLLTVSVTSRNLPRPCVIDSVRNVLEIGANRHCGALHDAGRRNSSAASKNRTQIAVIIEANDVAAVTGCVPSTTPSSMSSGCSIRAWSRSRQTQANVAEYAQMESRKLGIQVAFALDVRGDRADDPDGLGPDRAELRQLAGSRRPGG